MSKVQRGLCLPSTTQPVYVEAAVGSALIKQRLDSLDSSALDSSSGEQERRARVAILEMTGLRGIPGGFLAVIPILDKSGHPQLLGIHPAFWGTLSQPTLG